jgi:hypothetical protein
MSTNIYNYNGTLETTIPDGSIDNTTSLALPGRGYLNYGEPVNQNMLWIMQNFANSSAPTNPVVGQLWYNTSNNNLQVYTAGSAWVSAGGAVISTTQPTGLTAANAGALWFDNTNKQMWVWSGTTWLLIGPLGSVINANNPINPALPSNSVIRAAQITDTVNSNHQVWEIIIAGTLIAIFSLDGAFNTTISGFTTVNPGLNFSSTVAGGGAGVSSPTAFTSVKTNLPSADNTFDMGSASYRFSNMYAINFHGQATSALYADLAERYAADRPMEPGTVVCLGGEREITPSITIGSQDVFGVVSTEPAYLMNSAAGDDVTFPPVAMMGRVPCRVVGPVQKGQRLMASALTGCACAYDPKYTIFSVIGRSLVTKPSDGVDTIEIVIGKI